MRIQFAIVLCVLWACGHTDEQSIDLGGGPTNRVFSKALAEGDLALTVHFTLTNSGTCRLDYGASLETAQGTGWLQLNSTSAGGIDPKGTAILDLIIDVATPQLTAGLYTGTVLVAAVCEKNAHPATGSPAAIAVNVSVQPSRAVIGAPAGYTDMPNLLDHWAAMATGGQPDPNRVDSRAVWTGSEV